MKKNRGQRSRATVPLNIFLFKFLSKIFQICSNLSQDFFKINTYANERLLCVLYWEVEFLELNQNKFNLVSVRNQCGGWSEEVNSCILTLSYMVYL